MKKHVRGSALLATMLVTAVVSGAIVYNLEHSLFENALQQNYALYQKEFNNQKLAIDTLRLKLATQSSSAPEVAGKFCTPGEPCSPNTTNTFELGNDTRLILTPKYNYSLELDAPALVRTKTLDSNIFWNEEYAKAAFATTSVPTIALLHIDSLTDGLEWYKVLHYIDTAKAHLVSISITHSVQTTFQLWDAKRTLTNLVFRPESGGILVNDTLALPIKQSGYKNADLFFEGIDTSLTNVYIRLSLYNGTSSELKPILISYNLNTKKATVVKEFKNLLK